MAEGNIGMHEFQAIHYYTFNMSVGCVLSKGTGFSWFSWNVFAAELTQIKVLPGRGAKAQVIMY